MEFSHSKNYYVPGMESLFGERALRINVTLESEAALATESKYRKLVVVVPRKCPYFYIWSP